MLPPPGKIVYLCAWVKIIVMKKFIKAIDEDEKTVYINLDKVAYIEPSRGYLVAARFVGNCPTITVEGDSIMKEIETV